MADINPISLSNVAAYTKPARAAGQTSAETSGSTPTRGDDAVQLSTHARLLSKLQELPEVRQDLVDRVRDQIDAGIFESPEKINAAVEGLLEDLA